MNNISTLKGTEKSVLELIKHNGFEECSICLEINIYNLCTTKCNHKFCKKCIMGHIKDNGKTICRVLSGNNHPIPIYNCPTCREQLTDYPTNLKYITLNNKCYKCNCDENINFTLEDYYHHVYYKCIHREVKCYIEKCNQEIMVSDYQKHCYNEHYCLHAFLYIDRTCHDCGTKQ